MVCGLRMEEGSPLGGAELEEGKGEVLIFGFFTLYYYFSLVSLLVHIVLFVSFFPSPSIR